MKKEEKPLCETNLRKEEGRFCVIEQCFREGLWSFSLPLTPTPPKLMPTLSSRCWQAFIAV